jgi:3-oxoacyl-[acyl-carrier-protein] synthase-3
MSASSFDMWPPVAIAGTGSYVPERVVTNEDLITAGGLDTTDAWIVEKTGIRERRFAHEDQTTSQLASEAARRALEAADTFPEDIDLVIVATSTPDWPQPATASAVHHALGLRPDAGAMDVNVVCSGFVYALHAGAAMLAGSEAWNSVLVIGADTYSRITDPQDRGTRVFFGDGAGAVVLQKRLEFADVAAMAAAEAGIDAGEGLISALDGGMLDEETPGIRSIAYSVDHARKDAIIVPEPGAYFQMDGPGVREFAVPAMVEAVQRACDAAAVDVQDLALLVPHQSNRRMLEAAIDALDMPESRLATTVERYGNTAAASIPITLDAFARAGRLFGGDLICLVGYGGGLQSAAAVLRWG